MTKYFFHVHYADGLTKKGEITQEQLDKDLSIWQDEMLNTDDTELVYLKIRKVKK